MFETVITVDLPSVERPGAAPGDASYAPSHDRVAWGSARLLDVVRGALARAGVTDLTWVRVDGDVVYADEHASEDDEVGDLLARAAREGFLGRPFQRLELGLMQVAEGVRHALELEVRTEVPAGEPELRLVIGSRPESWEPRSNESAANFAARLRDDLSRPEEAPTWRRHASELADRVSEALSHGMSEGKVDTQPTVLVLVRPDDASLDGIAEVPFGTPAACPTYSLAPEGREPRWAGPAHRVWTDPAVGLRHLLALDVLMEGASLAKDFVEVRDPSGRRLFGGAQAHTFARWPWRRTFELGLGQRARVVRT